MTHSNLDRTRAVRAWLAAGSEELSPRVRDNVLREFPRASQETPHWASPWPQFSSFAVGAAAGAAVAVTLVVAMIGAGLFAGNQRGGTGATSTPTPAPPSPTPLAIDYSYRDVGFIGLPPPGATPSDPTETELVENFWRPQRGGPPFTGAAFLYADGRLIWNEYFGEGYSRSTGWLEQSLTSYGMELVRGLAVETTDERPRLLDPAELPGLLPDAAWVDEAVRPYVPSGLAACLFVTGDPLTGWNMTRSEKLAALPPTVADLLRDRPFVRSDAYDGDSSGGVSDCRGLDVADARLLDAALRAADFEQDALWNRFLLEYHVPLDRPEDGTWALSVWFEPILPDGTITCSGCG